MKGYKLSIEAIDDDGTVLSAASAFAPSNNDCNDDAMRVAKAIGGMLRGFSSLDDYSRRRETDAYENENQEQLVNRITNLTDRRERMTQGRMRAIAGYWLRNYLDNNGPSRDAMAKLHVQECLREINRLRRALEALANYDADGVTLEVRRVVYIAVEALREPERGEPDFVCRERKGGE